MTGAEQIADNQSRNVAKIRELTTCKLVAIVAWISGLALVLTGLVLLIGDAPESNRPSFGALVLGYGLIWVGMGMVLLKNPRRIVLSVAALASSLTALAVLLLGSPSFWGGPLMRWIVFAWALAVFALTVVVFVQASWEADFPPQALPEGTAFKVIHLAAAAPLQCLRNTTAIAWRELKRYFRSPSSYIILALFLVYQGLIFYIAVRYLNDPRAPHGAPMKFFFGGPFWFWPLECFIIAIITMDTLAHEQIRRTVEPMMTAPVHEAELVLGKFLGALGFFFFLWAWTFLYVIIMVCHTKGAAKSTILQLGLMGGFGGLWTVLLVAMRRGALSGVVAWGAVAIAGMIAAATHPGLALVSVLKLLGLAALPVLAALGLRLAPRREMARARYGLVAILAVGLGLVAVQILGLTVNLFEQAGQNAPNIGPIVSGYIGAMLIGAAGIALGILYSSLTRDLKLACMLTFITLFLLIIVKIMLLPELNLIDTEWVRDLMKQINFFDYMYDFSRGIVDTRQVTLLLSLIVVCLFGASRAVQIFKWR
jgi:ABC-type transport system involved in multi-copper enzyme maturation permease subunit